MDKNINLIKPITKYKKTQKKKRSLGIKLIKIFLFLFLAYFIIAFALSSKVIFSQDSLGRILAKLPVVSQIKTILGVEDLLTGQNNDRVNILLTGIGGSGHDGALLTDSIMLISVRLSTQEISLISVPRDLYVKIPGNGWQRINHANAYGELNDYPGGGSALLAKTMEKTFGIPIDYWLRIDFTGFKQLIDDIGGVDIYVDREFIDTQYPTQNFGIQTISFKQGYQHLNSERALQFARSRHGNNGEGSDFARSKRQQKILLAIKDKILSWKFLTNPNQLYKLYENIRQHIQTNITPAQFPDLINLTKNLDFNSLKHYVIDDSPGGLLKPMVTDAGAQVLVPKAGDLSELQAFIENIFIVREIQQNNVSVIIINGTTVDGLASYIGYNLNSWGFNIQRLLTAPQQNFEKTVIYDLTHGQQMIALKILKQRLKANTTEQLPSFIKNILPTELKTNLTTGFVVVVGADQQRAIKNIMEWRRRQELLQALKEQAANKKSSTTPQNIHENNTQDKPKTQKNNPVKQN